MIKGKLISRTTKLAAPKGYKKMLVFGVVTVPEDSTLDADMTHTVTGVQSTNYVKHTSSLTLHLTPCKRLGRKFRAWDAPAVCEALWSLASMREQQHLKDAEQGLALCRDGLAHTKEARGIAKRLKSVAFTLPTFDTMRQVFLSVVGVVEKSEKK